MKAILAIFVLLALASGAEASQKPRMRYTKIVGTFLKFENGQRLDAGIAYASQELKLDQNEIIVRTFGHGKPIETHFRLQGPKFLDFVATSDDPAIPEMTGHFLNSDYDECIVSASMPSQGVNVSGVVTKLDQANALSTKTITDLTSGRVVAILQERVEIISEESFKAATDQE